MFFQVRGREWKITEGARTGFQGWGVLGGRSWLWMGVLIRVGKGGSCGSSGGLGYGSHNRIPMHSASASHSRNSSHHQLQKPLSQTLNIFFEDGESLDSI